MRIAALCLISLFALAAAPSFAGPQQEKMKTCNADASAKSLKGDARKAFMKECLSSASASAPMTQQNKMKMCNKDASAKNLKGDARKSFMSDCLKK